MTTSTPTCPQWLRWVEMAAIVVTGLCKFVFVDLLPYKGWYVGIACSLWIAYIIYLATSHKARLRTLGFTREGFRKSFVQLLPLAGICVILFLAIGLVNDNIILNLHIFPVLLLYPIWGVIQQFMMMALFAGNLYYLKGGEWHRITILGATAVVFSIVHLPSGLLAGGTFILAIVYTYHYLYRHHRNLWVLGIYHGWLACFYYYWVLHRDAWLEIAKVFL